MRALAFALALALPLLIARPADAARVVDNDDFAYASREKFSFFEKTLVLEWEFNQQAGFTEKDNELPSFFYTEPLAPTGKIARHLASEVSNFRDSWVQKNTQN